MFPFTQEPSSGSYDQYLAKITSLVQLLVSVRTLSVLWLHTVTCRACVWFTVVHSSLRSEPNTHTHTHAP